MSVHWTCAKDCSSFACRVLVFGLAAFLSVNKHSYSFFLTGSCLDNLRGFGP